MGPVEQFMAVYQHVFNPLPFIVLTGLVLVVSGWRREGTRLRALTPRILTLCGLTTVALVPMSVVIFTTDVGFWAFLWLRVWFADPLLAASLFVASAMAWYIWTANDWGDGLRVGATALAVTALCYGVITLFWNVSGHVTFTLVPALVLVYENRAYWPLLAVPLVMIPNRPMLGVHTWPQTIGGVVLGVAGVAVAVAVADRAGTPRRVPAPP